MANHVILHIPHSSTFIPDACQFELSQSELSQEIEKLTDHQTDTLFSCKGAAKLVFPVNRWVALTGFTIPKSSLGAAKAW